MSADPSPPMHQLRVAVPTAVTVGQEIAFTTPDGQQLLVRAAEDLGPGSILVVEYQPPAVLHATAQQALTAYGPPSASSQQEGPASSQQEGPSPTGPYAPEHGRADIVPGSVGNGLMQPATVNVQDVPASGPDQTTIAPPTVLEPGRTVTTARIINGVLFRPANTGAQDGSSPLLPEARVSCEETDRHATMWAWRLYFAGLCCCLCCGPPGALIWVVVAASYYCKRRSQREQFPLLRKPALASMITFLTILTLSVVCAVAHYHLHGHHHHHGHGRHHHHGALGQVKHEDSGHHHHHGPGHHHHHGPLGQVKHEDSPSDGSFEFEYYYDNHGDSDFVGGLDDMPEDAQSSTQLHEGKGNKALETPGGEQSPTVVI